MISPVQRSAALNRGMFFRIAFSQRQSGRRCGRAQGPAVVILPTRARVQAHRVSSSVLALHEGVPRAMDHHSSGCLPAEKFPTFASGRQGRGPVRLLSFRSLFPLTRRPAGAQPFSRFGIFPVFPESGKGERASVFHGDSKRQLRFSCFAPFVESVRRNQTPSLAECLPERGRFIDGLSSQHPHP